MQLFTNTSPVEQILEDEQSKEHFTLQHNHIKQPVLDLNSQSQKESTKAKGQNGKSLKTSEV